MQDKFRISVARVAKIMYRPVTLYAEVTEKNNRKLLKGRRV